MAVKTYTEQLESVQNAIAQIEAHGQSYQIMDGGSQRMLTRANLKDLYARETWLRKMADKEANGGGIRYSVGVPR
jgi:hypothetical protein